MNTTRATLGLAAAMVAFGATRVSAQQTAQTMISAERARSIALAHVSNQQGVLSEKLKEKHGLMLYEIDVETPGPGIRRSASTPTPGRFWPATTRRT